MLNRILIIDDEELVARSLLRFLSSAGYKITLARSGVEALKKIKKAEFDLIISDVRMPRIDGVQTIKSIRAFLKKAKRTSPPELLISGYADAKKYEAAMKLKVKDYIYKPFDNKEFLHVIKKAIG